MGQLYPVYTALFQAVRELDGTTRYIGPPAANASGIKHPAAARVRVGGAQVTIDPFNRPDATTVTRINTLFTPGERARVVAATRTDSCRRMKRGAFRAKGRRVRLLRIGGSTAVTGSNRDRRGA